jgi:hypothetical protein
MVRKILLAVVIALAVGAVSGCKDDCCKNGNCPLKK